MSASAVPSASPLSVLPGRGAHVATAGRQRVAEPASDRVRRDGKFFRIGAEKFFVKGVTYGPFAPNSEGGPLPERPQVCHDFRQIVELGANCVRLYHIPPQWMLELAQELGLKLFLDVCWPKNLSFVGDADVTRQARDAVREAARECGNHPALFAISVANEIPPDLVRFIGAERVGRFIDDLIDLAKAEAPRCLVTFANFPTTEYLRPRKIDFACFNVYLDDEKVLRNYLARLQMIAGDLPLMLGEYGVDTFQCYPEHRQAEMLRAQLKATFEEGLAGTFVFSFTDDWFVHGWQIHDWCFGITRRERDESGRRLEKPAFAAVRDTFRRVPQTADERLPTCSVVICSYNGASTVESCLRSMAHVRYPGGFEVVFVDDGSRDDTQEILKQFPWVRNIRQPNMGLSYARNVGLREARGEVVVYTDSDCEADEDWLYYMALALVRGGYVGMGGPNLIPDEGSWVADCVGLSPGGPTHVMIDDRTAEHVPGCNMAYYKWALEQVNGFDPQFRAAGDDVDVIWRLQNLGHAIGFAHGAQVWHYRRNTVRAYLRQQRGYGVAEAMLKYKHPDRFNVLGASHWRGRIYGGQSVGLRVGGDVIYHGLFGTGLFQTIYRRPASVVLMMMMSVEWHLLTAFIALLGLALPPLLWAAACMVLTPAALAAWAGAVAPRPRHAHGLSRALIAYLHWRQPVTRGWARYSVRLRAKVMKPIGYRRPAPLPFDPRFPDTLRYWSEAAGHDRLQLLSKVADEVRALGWRVRLDSGWQRWDMEIYGSRYVKVRLLTATEHHDQVKNGKLTRVRVRPMMSNFARVLLAASLLLAGLIVMHVPWPFGRTAFLIPLAWWSMFLVNRWHVATPVLGLIDAVAEKSGYWPVYPKRQERRRKARKAVSVAAAPTEAPEPAVSTEPSVAA